jgi:hypothetical protein
MKSWKLTKANLPTLEADFAANPQRIDKIYFDDEVEDLACGFAPAGAVLACCNTSAAVCSAGCR